MEERMQVEQVFDAPRAIAWKAWTEPQSVMRWWGPKGFTSPSCVMDFRVGGTFLFSMRTPDGQEFYTGGAYREIVPEERIVFSMYFADRDGNKVDPASLGIEHEADEDVFDTVTFEDLGDGQTRMTYRGNETRQSAEESGQAEGMRQILDKLAVVVGELRGEG